MIADPAPDVPPPGPEELGGDPVCWAHLLCPECGAVPEGRDDQRCARCGAELPPADH